MGPWSPRASHKAPSALFAIASGTVPRLVCPSIYAGNFEAKYALLNSREEPPGALLDNKTRVVDCFLPVGNRADSLLREASGRVQQLPQRKRMFSPCGECSFQYRCFQLVQTIKGSTLESTPKVLDVFSDRVIRFLGGYPAQRVLDMRDFSHQFVDLCAP